MIKKSEHELKHLKLWEIQEADRSCITTNTINVDQILETRVRQSTTECILESADRNGNNPNNQQSFMDMVQ